MCVLLNCVIDVGTARYFPFPRCREAGYDLKIFLTATMLNSCLGHNLSYCCFWPTLSTSGGHASLLYRAANPES